MPNCKIELSNTSLAVWLLLPKENYLQITKKSNCLLTLTPSPSCKTSSRIEDQNFIDTFHQTPCIQSFHPCLVHCESTSLIYRIRRKMPTEHDPDPFTNCHPCLYEWYSHPCIAVPNVKSRQSWLCRNPMSFEMIISMFSS